MYIANNGYVGINTTAPTAYISIQDPTVSKMNYVIGAVEKGYLSYTGTTDVFDINSDGTITLSPGNTVAFTALANGNVGIGNLTPANKLDIGDNTGKQFLRLNGAAAGPTAGSLLILTSGAIQHNIGANAPLIASGASADLTIYAGGSTNQRFYTNGAERARLDSSGNFGINTTNPNIKLTVSDTSSQLKILDNDSTDTSFTGGTLFSSNAGVFTIQGTNSANSSSAVYFSANQTTGNVTFGGSIVSPKVTTLPTSGVSDTVICVDAVGNLTKDISGSCYLTASSDIRLKTNIATVTSALDKVKGLNTINYNWIDTSRGTATEIGYSAQDVQKVIPEAVVTDSEGFLKVNYVKLSAIYANAIKELDDKVFKKFDEIIARITGIENRTTVLEQKVNHLENLLQVQSSSDLNLNNLVAPAAPWVDPNGSVVPATPEDTTPNIPVVPAVVDPQNSPTGAPTPAPVAPETTPNSVGSNPIDTSPAEAPAVTPAG
jgi:hypothetical protein